MGSFTFGDRVKGIVEFFSGNMNMQLTLSNFLFLNCLVDRTGEGLRFK